MPDALKELLTAAFVATMNGPVLRDAGVVHARGRIVAVGDAKRLRADQPDAVVRSLGDVVLMPGLVNPHTHLELSACGPTDACHAGSFTDWILALRPRLLQSGRSLEEMTAEGVRIGVAQCLRFGVTTVGDISQRTEITRPLLTSGPLRVVSYGEALGLATVRQRFEQQLATATDRSLESPWLRVGLSPHAPYTVDRPGYERCIAIARERNLPLATHLAETADETEFLTQHTGPFRKVWEQLGTWADPVDTFDGPPVAMAASLGLLDYPTLLAHVNYCDDAELTVLANGRASIVYCPRTHTYFRHPPHRWRDMLTAGIHVAIGTDSCASSPDLNLVDELRLLHRIAPEFPVDALWKLATVNAARALQMDAEVGTIAAGRFADFVAFDVATDDPLREILEIDRSPVAVWIGGSRVN
jgi:cytosine/adenosine deaminase-related metal-dependent hydrolase